MGPTNVSLVKLFLAEQRLREAQGRLDSVSRNVRIQQLKVNDLSERHRLTASKLRDQQSQQGQIDLDIKSRDARIERLRVQQQNTKNNREYQAFLIEINTEKVDKGKAEDEILKVMEAVEELQAEAGELQNQREAEKTRLTGMQAEINERVNTLQHEIDELKPERDAAAAGVPVGALQAFERLADKFDGEAMSALTKPDRRREEYACSVCNMDLVTDIYNKLHSRDELVFCPSCHRILYIPADLPLELAVNKVKEKREPRGKADSGGDASALKASIGRQTAAEDVMKSVTLEEDPAPNSQTEETPPSTDNPPEVSATPPGSRGA